VRGTVLNLKWGYASVRGIDEVRREGNENILARGMKKLRFCF